MIFDFGFELSGTRAVARARQSPDDMPEVVHGVQSAKSLLVLATVPLLLIGFVAIPVLREHSALFAWALGFAVLRGFSPALVLSRDRASRCRGRRGHGDATISTWSP